MQLVDEIRQEQPRIGTRKLVDRLKTCHDTEVGRDHLFTLLGREGRLVKRPIRVIAMRWRRIGSRSW